MPRFEFRAYVSATIDGTEEEARKLCEEFLELATSRGVDRRHCCEASLDESPADVEGDEEDEESAYTKQGDEADAKFLRKFGNEEGATRTTVLVAVAFALTYLVTVYLGLTIEGRVEDLERNAEIVNCVHVLYGDGGVAHQDAEPALRCLSQYVKP